MGGNGGKSRTLRRWDVPKRNPYNITTEIHVNAVRSIMSAGSTHLSLRLDSVISKDSTMMLFTLKFQTGDPYDGLERIDGVFGLSVLGTISHYQHVVQMGSTPNEQGELSAFDQSSSTYNLFLVPDNTLRYDTIFGRPIG